MQPFRRHICWRRAGADDAARYLMFEIGEGVCRYAAAAEDRLLWRDAVSRARRAGISLRRRRRLLDVAAA